MSGLEIVQVLGAIGEFVGAIAVVVTLIYLSRQVRDSSRSAQAAAVEAGRTRRIASFESIRDSPYIPAIEVKLARGEAIDAEEQLRISNHYAALWGLLYAEWIQRDLGTLGKYATRPELGFAQTLGSPVAMEWWRNAGVQIYPQKFLDFVDTMMQKIDLDDATLRMERAGLIPEESSGRG